MEVMVKPIDILYQRYLRGELSSEELEKFRRLVAETTDNELWDMMCLDFVNASEATRMPSEAKQNLLANIEQETQTKRKPWLVRYVAANRALTTIATNKTNEDASVYLSNGKQHELHFKAQSGFPMYLLVNGVGPRGSSIKATISAISEDGFTIVKPLKVNEHQNEEGIGKLKGPFCAYIILP